MCCSAQLGVSRKQYTAKNRYITEPARALCTHSSPPRAGGSNQQCCLSAPPAWVLTCSHSSLVLGVAEAAAAVAEGVQCPPRFGASAGAPSDGPTVWPRTCSQATDTGMAARLQSTVFQSVSARNGSCMHVCLRLYPCCHEEAGECMLRYLTGVNSHVPHQMTLCGACIAASSPRTFAVVLCLLCLLCLLRTMVLLLDTLLLRSTNLAVSCSCFRRDSPRHLCGRLSRRAADVRAGGWHGRVACCTLFGTSNLPALPTMRETETE
eukprot:COSAG03_NODE_468_length_7665_cov_6.302670_5_plen_265_part_00